MRSCNKVMVASLFGASALLSVSVQAEDSVSANVGFTSDYLWRGMTQTDGAPAISGGLDYSAASGLYAGTWASNIDFGDDATYEWDFYAGYAGEVSGIGYDLGYIYYAYPNGDDLDFSEIYASASYQILSVGVAVLVDSDFDKDFGDDLYYNADISYDVGGVALGFHVGYYDIDGSDSQTDYNISLSKNGFTFMIADTDIDGDDVKAVIAYSVDIDI